MGFVEELSWRGLVQQSSDERLGERMNAEPLTLYCGFDPTADSLHVGSLVPLMALARAQRAGHKPIAVVGGATGMIGDPSGKTEERKLLSVEELERNVAGVRCVIERFLGEGAVVVNNYDWFSKLSALDYLRDVGKQFSVNMMLAKESVRARLEDREHGISYTEFSYMLIQAYDFLELYKSHGCKLQIGGSDQWGNITAGIDLIRRKVSAEAFGLTLPLITTSAGSKFGKTEKGAVWLTTERTSPYDLYQFFLRADDRDVGRYLRFFTFLDEKTIVALDETVVREPEKREAQRVLAREVTTLIHGAAETVKAQQAAKALFAGELTSLDAGQIEQLLSEAPSSEEPVGGLDGAGLPLMELLARTKLCASKGAARRDIEGGGIYVNDQRVADVARAIGRNDLLAGKFVVLRKGKKSYHLVRFQ
jgi:tyrosyl-tRNA synthetase